MLIKEILYLVGKYLGDSELCYETQDGYASSDGVEVMMPYIKLINLVQKRLATECFVLKTKETISVTKAGEFPFSSLSKPFFKLIKIMQNNKPVRFELVNSGVVLPIGDFEIWYQYTPEQITFASSKVCDFNGKISERIYALGVASEYCLLNGMYDTANFFEEKFLNAINLIKMGTNLKLMPKRRWL